MASTLPTNIAVSTTGHPGLHNAVNAAVNEHDGRISSLEGRATALESVATIVGAGRPDVTASMTTAVQAKVAAAPVGSTFSSTDGASVGAWLWGKLTTGWAVLSGDTGFRDIGSLLVNGWTASTLLMIRTTNELSLIVENLDASKSTSPLFVAGLPIGMRFFGGRIRQTLSTIGFPVVSYRISAYQTPDELYLPYTTTKPDPLYGNISCSLAGSNAWPTTIPGIASAA